ncbi:acetyl-CoA C-acyltransferase [Halobacillus shinanisalinarum]|uniref:acetyl-CoA C-acetyltransferase n=1 Tax=Halobacillus shinanisalinarum TaxID=2932258 RepID=A0ABY4GWS8_9BACI|nr:acetyl-CoA C-acyltransferase [Halobacillus shinanisalinarum]UOQ92593.1 acetyl-CoA C-acyltransferase [Halobacillus shinanisalinarum]
MSVVILDGVRTPFGKWKGGLSKLGAKDLGVQATRALMERVPEALNADGVILAQVLQAGQGQNPARAVAAGAGVSWAVPAITINNVCLAGVASVADAARRIKLEEGQLYIVGGFDSMTNAPHVATLRNGLATGPVEFTDTLINDGLWCSLTDSSMGGLTDIQNEERNIKREEQDQYALDSQLKAARAQEQGLFNDEIVPVHVGSKQLAGDEGIRPQSTLDKLSSLVPAFRERGTITAGNASQMTDGASVGVVASESYAQTIGKTPLARVIGWSETAGSDSSLHTKPADAIAKLFKRYQLTKDDIDLFEINEAFASVALASIDELGLDPQKVNVNGGAIAIGHPLGGTGFRLVLTLIHELKRRGADGASPHCVAGRARLCHSRRSA